MFQSTRPEFENLMSQNVISSWGSRRFTEQGIYMLMTVLKGDTAVEQSKVLIRLFETMKGYIIENQLYTTLHNYRIDRTKRSQLRSQARSTLFTDCSSYNDFLVSE